jgi:hypothetical protein
VGPYNLGLALAALGEAEEARSALLRAAALEPDDREIREALQSLLCAQPAASDPRRSPRRASAATSGRFALPEVLEFLRLQKKTGSLVVSSRRGAAIVRLVRGQVTSASAPGVKRLGEALDRRGIITAAALERRWRGNAPTTARARRRWAPCCCANTPATAKRSPAPCSSRCSTRCGEMQTWNEGGFSFHPGSDRGLPAIAFDLQNVMLELMRIADERKETSSST